MAGVPLEAVKDELAERVSAHDIHLFEIGGTQITAVTLIVVGLIFLATLLFSKLLQRSLRRLLAARGIASEGELWAVLRIVHYATLFVGFGIGLNTIGVNLTALFTAGAVFAVALGFAMQNITENFASGVILLVERSIKPGDVVELKGLTVKIERMGIRATVARTLDDEHLIVPNTELVQSTVKNYTFRDLRYRLRARVGVAYGSDMDAVHVALREAAEGLSFRLSVEPRVLLIDFADSAVVWEVSIWIDDPWQMRRLRSELHLALWRQLGAAGITIAFPQLDVHLDPPVVERLGWPEGGGTVPARRERERGELTAARELANGRRDDQK